jgi:hypothetical protein
VPYYRCAACKSRLYSAASPADLVGGLYPERGSLIEPVGELLDLERWVDQQVDDRVGPILARREAISAARTSVSSGGG